MKKKINVLVVGAPRSGTTLVAGLLSAGKEASPGLPECTFLTQIIQHYYNLIHYSDQQRFSAYAINKETLTKVYRDMIDSMLSIVRSHFKNVDYQYLILKDPELTNIVDLVPIFFGEDSKIVCVIRDPRAVISSVLKVERKKKKIILSRWGKDSRFKIISEFIAQFLRERSIFSDFFVYYWRIQNSKLYKEGKIHIARYEKIVELEDDEFNSLEKYLGFKISREGFGKMAFGFDKKDPTYSSGYGGKIQKQKSDFRKILTKRQIKKIEKIFSGLNNRYGWW
jgi:hypothetical protein